jgi:hypothetical protein
MAAPTKPAKVKKALANSEPSTHGTKQTVADARAVPVPKFLHQPLTRIRT